MSRLGFRFSQCSGWVGVFLPLLPVASGDSSVFLFSRLKGDETILPCLCLKTTSIWRPLRIGSCQRVRDPSRLWPSLTLAHHTSSGLSLTARIGKYPFGLYSTCSSLQPPSFSSSSGLSKIISCWVTAQSSLGLLVLPWEAEVPWTTSDGSDFPRWGQALGKWVGDIYSGSLCITPQSGMAKVPQLKDFNVCD